MKENTVLFFGVIFSLMANIGVFCEINNLEVKIDKEIEQIKETNIVCEEE